MVLREYSIIFFVANSTPPLRKDWKVVVNAPHHFSGAISVTYIGAACVSANYFIIFFNKIFQKVVYKPIPLLIIHFPKRKTFYSHTNSWSIIHDTLNSLIFFI